MNTQGKSIKIENLKVCIIAGLSVLLLMSAGCSSGDNEPKAGRSALVGAGLGALAGQAIGGDSKATLIGAGIGAGVGYVIGNEKDKKAAQSHNYNTSTPLTGTKWKVVSLVMKDIPQYESIVVYFRPDGILVTTRFEPGGTKTITEEKYRLVGNTLIIHKADYIINAEYKLFGDELIVNCERFRAVLRKI